MQEPRRRAAPGVFDVLDCGLIILDADERVCAWNAWVEAASGVAASAALDKGLREIFPRLSGRRLEAAVQGALKSGVSSFLTHSLHPGLLALRTRTGKELIHDLSVRPLGAGAPAAHCLIQISDVTVAAQREQILRRRQDARYAAAVDNAPDPILTTDEAGIIRLANPAAAQALGFEPHELVGMPVAGLFEDADAWSRAWSIVASGEPLRHAREMVARRKDGAPSYVDVSAAPWLNESRFFVTVILRDTNARHAAEAALRRLNETLEERVDEAIAERKLLADIVETTDAFIQILDLDYRLLAVNRASANEFERAFGVRPQVGDNLLQLMASHPADQAVARALWSRALAGEEFTTIQHFGATGVGRLYELKFDTLHDASGRRIAAFQFVYDVTERLEREAQLARAEEALRQSQKMEAIGQLTGGIAHDFNNLLMGITGSLDILRRRIAAGRYQDVDRFVEAATSSANRAAALTHRLLAFARRQPLDPRAIDVNQLVEGMQDLIGRTLGEQVTMSTELTPDPWPIRSDPNQLENAVLNLAINARDAMPGAGRLTIRHQNVSFEKPDGVGADEIAPGDYTVIQVIDTGTGIAADMLAKVVEPFFTTKPLGQGTGLGLSMIYGFVKQTGGHVRIESTVGDGTTISLYFPRSVGEFSEGVSGPSAAAPLGLGESVLLVEDDAAVRLLIAELLLDLGYGCTEATEATSAIPILTSLAQIDLLITDVGLPGMNGRQLAELARQHRPNLRVLFVTGYAQGATGDSGFLEPGMDMVTKPFTLDALALKIREILGGP